MTTVTQQTPDVNPPAATLYPHSSDELTRLQAIAAQAGYPKTIFIDPLPEHGPAGVLSPARQAVIVAAGPDLAAAEKVLGEVVHFLQTGTWPAEATL